MSHKPISLEMGLTVITAMNEAYIPSSSTVLLFTDSKCVLKWSSSAYGKLGIYRRKVNVFYAVIVMGGTFRNDPICGCGRAIILYGLVTVYIKLASCIQLFVSSTLSFIIIFSNYVVHIICTYMLAICVAFNSVCNSSFINPSDFNSSKVS